MSAADPPRCLYCGGASHFRMSASPEGAFVWTFELCPAIKRGIEQLEFGTVVRFEGGAIFERGPLKTVRSP